MIVSFWVEFGESAGSNSHPDLQCVHRDMSRVGFPPEELL